MDKYKGINIIQSYFILFEFFIISIILYLPFFVLKENTGIKDNSTTDLIAYILTHSLLIFYLIKKFKINITQFAIKKNQLSYKMLLITLLLITSFYILLYPISTFLESNIPLFNKNNLNETQNGMLFYLQILIFAPLLEEIIFRKILFTGLNKKYNIYVALINSSLIFSLIHFNFLQSFETFFGGLLIGWIYFKTKSLIYPIIAHFLNNLFYSIDNAYFSNNILVFFYNKHIEINFFIFLIFLVFFILTIKYLNLTISTKQDDVNSKLENQNLISNY